MKVAELMRRDVASCPVDGALDVAAQLMWDRRVGSVIVVSEGRPVGVLTDRDVAMAAQTQGRPLKDIPISVAMSSELASCAPDENVRNALKRMKQRGVRRCPVVDQTGAMQGVLSLDDLASVASTWNTRLDRRELAAAFAATAAGPVTDESGQQAKPGMPLRIATLAGDMSGQAIKTWRRLREQLEQKFHELEQERPDRGRAGRLGSRVARALSHAPRVIRRSPPPSQPEAQPPSEAPPPVH